MGEELRLLCMNKIQVQDIGKRLSHEATHKLSLSAFTKGQFDSISKKKLRLPIVLFRL